MPITKDLKPTEFELTVLCPVGVCIAQHTYAFDKELKNHLAQLKGAKEEIMRRTIKTHKDGKHKIGGQP